MLSKCYHAAAYVLVPSSREAESCRTAGNRAYFEDDWSSAIEHYSRGIHCAPGAASLYSHRAGAYLQRSWQGDAWLALQVGYETAGLL